MTVQGSLGMTGGSLQINGGLFFANGSSFTQSAGDILLDANGGDSAHALILDTAAINALKPAGVLSFGGTNTAPGHWLAPITMGNFTISGGSITLADPPLADTGFALFYCPATSSDIVFGGTHLIKFGGASQGSSNLSRGQGFGIKVLRQPDGGQLRLNNVTVTGGANKKLFTATGHPFVLWVSGQMIVVSPSGVSVGTGTGITLGQNGGN
jgi:hypothetical protein